MQDSGDRHRAVFFLAILQNSRREDPITVLQNWTEILRQRK